MVQSAQERKTIVRELRPLPTAAAPVAELALSGKARGGVIRFPGLSVILGEEVTGFRYVRSARLLKGIELKEDQRDDDPKPDSQADSQADSKSDSKGGSVGGQSVLLEIERLIGTKFRVKLRDIAGDTGPDQ